MGGGVRQGRRKTTVTVLLAFVALLAGACGEGDGGGDGAPAPATDGATPAETTPTGAGEAIPLGVLLPFTGEYSWVGDNVVEVAQLIVEEDVNAAGGIDGRPVRLVQGDTEGTVDTGVLAVQKLANTDRVVAFIGPTSLSFTGVRQVITDTGTPMISPTAGTTELDEAGTELFYRTVPSDSLGGRAIARAITDPGFLDRDDGFERAALMVGQAPALVSFAEPIRAGIEEFGGSLTATVEFSPGKSSYRSEVGSVLADDPDVIVLVAAPEDSARIQKDAFEAGYEGTWFVTQDQTNADYIALAGPELVAGMYGLVEAAPPEAEGLLSTFVDRLGHDPEIFQTNAYDSINVTLLAMLEAALAGEDITRDSVAAHLDAVANPDDGDVVVTSFAEGKEALEAGDGIDYQGLSGPVDFDEFGNITSPFAVQQVVDGAWTDVSILAAEDLE